MVQSSWFKVLGLAKLLSRANGKMGNTGDC